MNFIRMHWRGELPLATSFWINLFLINVLVGAFGAWLNQPSSIGHPVTAAQVAVVFTFITVLVVYPWQIVGVWRSANRYSSQPNSGIWGGATRVVVVMGVIATLGALSTTIPLQIDLFKLGFQKDRFSNYRVTLRHEGSLVHIQGGLGFGVSEDLEALLAENEGVTGIILDSGGGRVYEGRELAKIILANNLDTYTLTGCLSACTTAFIAGRTRYLADGANLGFHQYSLSDSVSEAMFDRSSEEEEDRWLYTKRGISQDFLERVFSATEDDMWYPQVDELIYANVVHDIVNKSDLIPINYGDFDTARVERDIASLSAYAAIKKYDPNTYGLLINALVAQFEQGASGVEIQRESTRYLEPIIYESLPLTSNNALVTFAVAMNQVLVRLEEIDPILCVKQLFPDKYGPAEVMKHLSMAEATPMLDAMSLVVVDRYESAPPELNVSSAEALFDDVFEQLGDSVYYLDAPVLNNKDDYSRACRAVIRFYETVLEQDTDIAANALRYAFGS